MSDVKTDSAALIDVFDRRVERRLQRRQFFRNAGGLGLGLVGGTLISACGGGSGTIASAAAAPTDAEILNFALNLEYLESQFYSYATTGSGLPAGMTTGVGTPGAVIPGQQVPFQDPVVQAYANEIAKDEREHVTFLRSALGSAAVAQPAIDIGGTDPNGAFSVAARAAGLVASGTAFNPYASDNNFLLGAFIFEDVGVTAYKGASPLISNKTFLEAAAGILAAEAYHAGLVRTVLYSKGIDMTSLISAANAISAARASLDQVGNDDQGISGSTPGTSNIVPLDSNGLAYSRGYGNVLNIVYLTSTAAMKGGFFPSGVNGTLNMSA
ncbi:ferritin-like domain-containing protein [Paraburkholderia megapolitana]|uniref:Ferritin-like domain-containing protein n=1 Tax=Paraburkholderia megapolitana TaxID=420953 RepID=A0A1I3ICJ4_9BURK|nr:ferritin-like domain-containing protein [Paraburkholderia megapolitana]QDQ85276.1 ferritin-like domain-containing protein [Paraburkholderia megapolitana]SFI45666.1 Ferritin-like domain-containing protein [Paraburkholderia megapolitana]